MPLSWLRRCKWVETWRVAAVAVAVVFVGVIAAVAVVVARGLRVFCTLVALTCTHTPLPHSTTQPPNHQTLCHLVVSPEYLKGRPLASQVLQLAKSGGRWPAVAAAAEEAAKHLDAKSAARPGSAQRLPAAAAAAAIVGVATAATASRSAAAVAGVAAVRKGVTSKVKVAALSGADAAQAAAAATASLALTGSKPQQPPVRQQGAAAGGAPPRDKPRPLSTDSILKQRRAQLLGIQQTTKTPAAAAAAAATVGAGAVATAGLKRKAPASAQPPSSSAAAAAGWREVLEQRQPATQPTSSKERPGKRQATGTGSKPPPPPPPPQQQQQQQQQQQIHPAVPPPPTRPRFSIQPLPVPPSATGPNAAARWGGPNGLLGVVQRYNSEAARWNAQQPAVAAEEQRRVQAAARRLADWDPHTLHWRAPPAIPPELLAAEVATDPDTGRRIEVRPAVAAGEDSFVNEAAARARAGEGYVPPPPPLAVTATMPREPTDKKWEVTGALWCAGVRLPSHLPVAPTAQDLALYCGDRGKPPPSPDELQRLEAHAVQLARWPREMQPPPRPPRPPAQQRQGARQPRSSVPAETSPTLQGVC